MKKLVVFEITGLGTTYGKKGPEQTSFVPQKYQSPIPCDWREEVLNAADEMGWDITTSEIESVATMLDFLIAHEPAYSDCIRRSDVQLPGGVVLLDSTAGGEQGPIMLLWEEEGLADQCDECCKLLRKECPGKLHAELTFSPDCNKPDCYEKCSAEHWEDCPYRPVNCEQGFQEIPD